MPASPSTPVPGRRGISTLCACHKWAFLMQFLLPGTALRGLSAHVMESASQVDSYSTYANNNHYSGPFLLGRKVRQSNIKELAQNSSQQVAGSEGNLVFLFFFFFFSEITHE
jgi:hypothetical protein